MIIAAVYLAAASVMDCRIVTDDVIRMRDLAAAAPAFSSIDGNSVVSYSPTPGATRIVREAELARLAARYGIVTVDIRSLCFQREMRQLDASEMLHVIYRALSMPTADVELVDFSHSPVPVGDIVFPRAGLSLTPSVGPSFWKGYIVYGGGQHFPIWARVRIRARLNRVVATDNLVTGKQVRADQVRIEPLDGVPDAMAPAQSIEQVVGKNLLRPVRRGATISLDDLSTALVVRRGDKVDVDLESPALRLRFEAAAEMDGRLGDRIRLRNLQTRVTFLAEVSGKDQARVVLSEETNHSGADLRLAGALCSGRGQEEKGCR